MIITTALAISTATFAAAWVLERRARSDAEAGRSLAEDTSEYLRAGCKRLANELAKERVGVEASEELQEIGVIQHLESTARVTDYKGLPVYTWHLSSPYPTLAEAVRHVPARR